jgi:hypothetical protein
MRSLMIAIPLLAAACGGSEPPPQKATPAPAPASITAEEARQGCVETPPGIAAKDAEIGRDALVAGARTEWAEDSKDEAIAATCESTLEKMPPELIDELMPMAKECQTKDACPAYVECMMPIQEKLFTSAPKP